MKCSKKRAALRHKPAVHSRQGFTLVEVAVIIVIAGAMMTLGYQLLRSVVSSEATDSSPLQLEGLFSHARSRAISDGKILSLVINLDKKTMGLRAYRPDLEAGQDAGLRQLWENRTAYIMPQEEKEELAEERKEDQVSWLIEPADMPVGLDKVYSVSGLELPGPIIHIHFYPNATSDSIIFRFDGREKPYMFLPRQSAKPMHMKNLDFNDTALPEAQEK